MCEKVKFGTARTKVREIFQKYKTKKTKMAKRKSASSTEEVKDWSWDQAKGYFLLSCGHLRRNVYEFLFKKKINIFEIS